MHSKVLRSTRSPRVNCFVLNVLTGAQVAALNATSGAVVDRPAASQRVRPSTRGMAASSRQRLLLDLFASGLNPHLLQSTALLQLAGSVPEATIAEALNQVQSRHSMLRMRATSRERLEAIEGSVLTSAEGGLDEAREWARESLSPYDGLWKARQFRSRGRVVLALKTHDVGFDQTSVDLLVEEITCALEGHPFSSVEEFSRVEGELGEVAMFAPSTRGEEARKLVAFGGIDVDGDRAGTSGLGPTRTLSMTFDNFATFLARASSQRVTVYAAQLSAVLTSLRAMDTRQRRAVGITVDRRSLVDSEAVVGPLSQGAVLLVDLSGVKDESAVSKVQECMMDLLMEQGAAFESLLDSWRQIEPDHEAPAVVTINSRILRKVPSNTNVVIATDDVDVPIAGHAGADLMFSFETDGDVLNLRVDVNASLYSDTWVFALEKHLRRSLERWAGDVGVGPDHARAGTPSAMRGTDRA